MIKIQVMEKNGTPRELVFDKVVVTIGRSARNDVILPRSNVSKKHVTIEVSNDNCVLTDMGSTNGTFVNGQRIHKPVLVTPDDTVMVSDFTLKVWYEDDDIPEELSGVHEIIGPHSDDDLDAATHGGLSDDVIKTLPPSNEGRPSRPSRPSRRSPVPPSDPPGAIHDFDTKKITAEERKRELEKLMKASPPAGQVVHVPAPEPPAVQVVHVPAPEPPAGQAAPAPMAEPAPEPAPVVPRKRPRPPADAREVHARIFRQVSDYLQLDQQDIHTLGSDEFRKKAGRAIAEIIDTAVDDTKALPRDMEPKEISARLQSEILGLGPIEPLLSDAGVRDIHLFPSGNVVLMSSGQTRVLPDPFISEESRAFVLRKLIYYSGAAVQEGDSIITGSLEYGVTVKIVSPPLAVNGMTVVIQKGITPGPGGMSDLVARDVLSDKMATLLEYCLRFRKGILIADPMCLSHRTLIPALASMLPAWERPAALQCGNELIHGVQGDLYFKLAGEGSEVLLLSKSGESLFTVIPSFQPSALFVGELYTSQVLKLARLCAAARTAVIATVREPGPLDLLERIKQMVFNDYPEMDGDGLAKLATEGFGLVVCYSQMMDGSEKITSMLDIQTTKDGKTVLKPVFYHDMKEITEDGRIVGSFRATKAIPSFVEEKRQKGVAVDASIFQ